MSHCRVTSGQHKDEEVQNQVDPYNLYVITATTSVIQFGAESSNFTVSLVSVLYLCLHCQKDLNTHL